MRATPPAPWLSFFICLLTCGIGGIVTSIWAIIEACTVTQDANGVRFK
jgi:hypothetical protein